MKTKRKVSITVEYVDELPHKDLAEGVLYVDQEKMKLAHSCLCGCESLIHLPLSSLSIDNSLTSTDQWAVDWNLTVIENRATVHPSILNKPCNCHYIITNGVANIV